MFLYFTTLMLTMFTVVVTVEIFNKTSSSSFVSAAVNVMAFILLLGTQRILHTLRLTTRLSWPIFVLTIINIAIVSV